MSASFLTPDHQALQTRAAEAFAPLDAGALHVDDAGLASAVAATGLSPYLVPAAYGGVTAQVEVMSLCVLREELAYRNAAADSLFAVQGLGSHPLVLAGSEAQRQALLPRVAAGEVLFAFALTEPDAGSDVANLSTRAERTADGWRLSGQKRFISNAGVATHYTVFARTGEGPKGLSAFLVPATAPGFRVARQMELLGEHPIGELELDGCQVPADALVGEEGAGMRLALSTLDVFRSTVGAAAVGMARRALDEALSYVKTRRQFGAPLAELSAVQALLADCAVELEASRLLVHMAATTKDRGQARITYEAAVSKLFATEAAQRIVDRCLQVHGGNGVVKGFAVERLYRDVRALRIYEGASEVQRLVIARHLLGPR
ncbi:MAG: acyl-CoA dehydrogenase family protein [Myxococcaceae bacterium]|jgi:acyl-CoA dehydrogenase|nr:acyl-CoA dehydrogenase family protein [Myxococcaceae bacterium]MCA3013786.1 acyl-CoA dehydrogenase family protein [Myxococcaceae bacterium]